MPHVQPLFLPRPVVEENRLILENDFKAEPVQFCFGPDGRLHVLSHLFYNYYRYDQGDNRGFSTYLVSVPRSARVAIPEKDIPSLEDVPGPPW